MQFGILYMHSINSNSNILTKAQDYRITWIFKNSNLRAINRKISDEKKNFDWRISSQPWFTLVTLYIVKALSVHRKRIERLLLEKD